MSAAPFATSAVMTDVIPQPNDHFAPGGSKTGSVSRRTPSISRIVVAVPRCVIVIAIAPTTLAVLFRDRAFDPLHARRLVERHRQHVDAHTLHLRHLLQSPAPDPA